MNESFLRIQRTFFFILLGGATLAFFLLLSNFFTPILWALAFAVVFYPLYAWISRRLGGRRTAAALITVLCVVLVIMLPLIGIGNLIAREAIDLYHSLSSDTMVTQFTQLERAPFVQQLLTLSGTDRMEARTRIIEIGQSGASWMASQALSAGTNAASAAVKSLIMLYLLFVFLRNGADIGARIMAVLPLGNAKEIHLFDRFTTTVRALFRGTLIVALAQGSVGGILFALAGIPNPLLWGVVMAIFALVPAIGPGIVWLPASLILFATGDLSGGLIILIGGVVVVSLIDNLLRPILVGRDLEMSDALIMLSIIGGIVTFGFNGLIIGPVIAALFIASWSLFEQEYRHELAQRG